MLSLLIGLIFAAIFWFLIYCLKIVGFWIGVSVASTLLAIWSIINAEPDRKRLFAYKSAYLVWGIISAAIFYLIFWIGGIISTHFFSFAEGQLNAIYANKALLPSALATLLIILLVGSSEEIFWRGMAQRIFARWFGDNTGWLFGAIVYAVVYLWSVNFILVMTALLGGLYWGWLYKRFNSLWPGIISHVLWDLAVFLIFPLKYN